MAELADARDLKSREIYFSYRFDPGFRHHHIAEWSSLVARRAHNPKVVGSNPSSATKKRFLKRCRQENSRFPRVFFVFLHFSRIFKNSISMRIKRWHCPFRSIGRDLNHISHYWGAYLANISRWICPFLFFINVNSLCLQKIYIPPAQKRFRTKMYAKPLLFLSINKKGVLKCLQQLSKTKATP